MIEQSIENAALGIIGLAVGFGFFGFYLRKEIVEFHKAYFDNALDMKRKIEARFRAKSVELLSELIKDSDYIKDGVIKKDDFDAHVSKPQFKEKISDISNIIAESKKIMDLFHTIRDAKTKFANMWFLMAILTGVNTILVYDISEQVKSAAYASDALIIVVAIAMYGKYKDYADAERDFFNKMESEAP